MADRAADQGEEHHVIAREGGIPKLDAAAVWILDTLRHLLRRGQPGLRNAWEWVDSFDDLRDHMMVIREDEEQPANRCPVVPVRMRVEVDVWPESGEALPLEYEERELGARDNRRLVGKVAKVLIDHIALQQQAAIRYRVQSQQNNSSDAAEKADAYAMEVRARGRKALRGVDLEELARAVDVEVQVGVETRHNPDTRGPSANERDNAPTLEIDYVNDKLAVVTEGATTVQVKGRRQVWLLREVERAGGRPVPWAELVRADLAASGEEMDRRWRHQERRRLKRQEDAGSVDEFLEPATPRHATKEASLQRTGNRIRKALGKLGYHWHQDGHGACWDDEVS